MLNLCMRGDQCTLSTHVSPKGIHFSVSVFSLGFFVVAFSLLNAGGLLCVRFFMLARDLLMSSDKAGVRGIDSKVNMSTVVLSVEYSNIMVQSTDKNIVCM